MYPVDRWTIPRSWPPFSWHSWMQIASLDQVQRSTKQRKRPTLVREWRATTCLSISPWLTGLELFHVQDRDRTTLVCSGQFCVYGNRTYPLQCPWLFFPQGEPGRLARFDWPLQLDGIDEYTSRTIFAVVQQLLGENGFWGTEAGSLGRPPRAFSIVVGK